MTPQTFSIYLRVVAPIGAMVKGECCLKNLVAVGSEIPGGREPFCLKY